MAAFEISERRACRALGVPRSSQRYVGTEREREEELLLRIRALARENPRFGYRRIKALLVREGWSVNLKRVHRLWRREGLKVTDVKIIAWAVVLPSARSDVPPGCGGRKCGCQEVSSVRVEHCTS